MGVGHHPPWQDPVIAIQIGRDKRYAFFNVTFQRGSNLVCAVVDDSDFNGTPVESASIIRPVLLVLPFTLIFETVQVALTFCQMLEELEPFGGVNTKEEMRICNVEKWEAYCGIIVCSSSGI